MEYINKPEIVEQDKVELEWAYGVLSRKRDTLKLLVMTCFIILCYYFSNKFFKSSVTCYMQYIFQLIKWVLIYSWQLFLTVKRGIFVGVDFEPTDKLESDAKGRMQFILEKKT